MAHINELNDFVVVVLIVYQDRVLLVSHKKLKKWLPIGGHIELNEDPDEALFREVKEECGLEIEVFNAKPKIVSEGTKSLYTPVFLDIHSISGIHKHIGLYYFAKAKSDQFLFNKEEHDDIRWFDENDLDDQKLDLSPAVKFYAKEALKALR
jgi:8-oxo-dGTP pyrophosphatase MutT (NUDIX family)